MQTIDDYFTNATPSQYHEYERIRRIVFTLVPDATETMNYGIPTFKYKGKNLIHYGYFKNHVSIFPGSQPIELLKDKLHTYKLSKGTIQYDEKNPIPEEIVKELVDISAELIRQKA